MKLIASEVTLHSIIPECYLLRIAGLLFTLQADGHWKVHLDEKKCAKDSVLPDMISEILSFHVSTSIMYLQSHITQDDQLSMAEGTQDQFILEGGMKERGKPLELVLKDTFTPAGTLRSFYANLVHASAPQKFAPRGSLKAFVYLSKKGSRKVTTPGDASKDRFWEIPTRHKVTFLK